LRVIESQRRGARRRPVECDVERDFREAVSDVRFETASIARGLDKLAFRKQIRKPNDELQGRLP